MFFQIMPSGSASSGSDRVLWLATAACLVISVAMIISRWRSAEPAIAKATTGLEVVSAYAEAPRQRYKDDDEQVLSFKSRVSAWAPLEAHLQRAFLTYLPPAKRRRPAALRRVAQGGTAEACLAQAVYYEARGESEDGQQAVAQVVLNRMRSGVHPRSVCGVVFEGSRRRGCQFSFACDPRLGGRVKEPVAWRRAEAVAVAALGGRESTALRGAMNYHADYVQPGWSARLRRTAEIGRHIFYTALKPGSHDGGSAASSSLGE